MFKRIIKRIVKIMHWSSNSFVRTFKILLHRRDLQKHFWKTPLRQKQPFAHGEEETEEDNEMVYEGDIVKNIMKFLKKIWSFSWPILLIVAILICNVYLTARSQMRGYKKGVESMKHELVETGYAEYYRVDGKSEWRMRNSKETK